MSYGQWMAAAAEEYRRLGELLDTLGPEDWSRSTDCPAWHVQALVCHLVGAADATADTRELLHQVGAGIRRRHRGELLIDAMNAVQVTDRAGQGPDRLRDQLRSSGQRSVDARSRLPKPLRRLRLPLGRPLGVCALGRLLGCVYTRDAWMHRIDLARATGRPLELDPEHDGLIVDDAVQEWAELHRQVFDLTLTGPAGGSWSGVAGAGNERATWAMDAIEFCRILSGRGQASGLLTHRVVF